MKNHALVKFENLEHTAYITIRTRDTRLSFYLMRDTLADFINYQTRYHFIERDCNTLVEMYHKEAATVRIHVTHIGTGKDHNYFIDELDLHNLIDGYETRALARMNEVRANTVHLAGHAPTDKKHRRAFSKAIRDHFMWYAGRSWWTLWNDGKHSYYFRETLSNGNPGICGGLIYNGYSTKNAYSMHT